MLTLCVVYVLHAEDFYTMYLSMLQRLVIAAPKAARAPTKQVVYAENQGVLRKLDVARITHAQWPRPIYHVIP